MGEGRQQLVRNFITQLIRVKVAVRIKAAPFGSVIEVGERQGAIMTPTRRVLLASTIALAAPTVRRAQAETAEVLIAKQFGLLYLQQDVMERLNLIEKHAARLGLPNLKARFLRLAGTGPVTDALLSGKLHFASGGAPGAMLLWDRSRGAIKSCFAMNATDQKLLTVRPDLQRIEDLKPTDRIALPAAKTAPQAIWLQMAAASAFGSSDWARFDALTLSRAHTDSMAAMLGRTEINCHWSTSPFQERELADPAVHEVASSFRIMGLPSVTPNAIYANASFREENPITWKACLAAFQEATDFINKEPRQAVELYLLNSGDKDSVENVFAALKTSGNDFTLQPRGFTKIASFMADTGLLKRRPANLSDLFFPEAQGLGGT
jgi:NitT/TauT family transport system substrate-binding protein